MDQLLQQLAQIEPYRIAGRVRRCRGTLLVCGGLSGLVGLGDTCRIDGPSHNHHECDPPPTAASEPLLGEVVALDEAGVHLLPFSEVDGLGLGARVTVVRGHDRIRPGPGWIGRTLDPLGLPPPGPSGAGPPPARPRTAP